MPTQKVVTNLTLLTILAYLLHFFNNIDPMETKKNLRTYLRFLYENVNQKSI